MPIDMHQWLVVGRWLSACKHQSHTRRVKYEPSRDFLTTILVCSTGWITFWGEEMANTSSQLMMQTLTDIVQYGNGTGSVNLYVAHGGTNFGYWAGNVPHQTHKTHSPHPTPTTSKSWALDLRWHFHV